MGVGKNSKKARKAKRRIELRRRLRVERLSERRVLAAITGTVFEDVNLSMRQDAEESSLGGRLLYLDINDNAAIDSGEPVALGGEDGSFSFENIADGVYQLRIYNGTDSQQQSFPVQPNTNGDVVEVANGVQVGIAGDSVFALTDSTIEIADFQEGESRSITVGSGGLTGVQTLPDGTLIVTGGVSGSETAWLVDPVSGSVDPIDLAGDGQGLLWAHLALDGDGYGVALEESVAESFVRSIDASDTTNGISTTTSYHTVPPDAQVITSATGGRSVLAWAGTSGLQLSLWSNSTGTWINGSEEVDARSLVAFDGDAGLLVVRNDDGGVSVHDADANFATLKSLPDVTGPVALDAERELLLTISDDSTLQVIDVRDGEMIADLEVDFTDVGTVSDLKYDGSDRSLIVLGNQGMASMSLTPDAHRITVADGEDPDPVAVGLVVSGDNAAPTYSETPRFETLEDSQLIRIAPGVLQGASDDDSDGFVVVRTAPPSNGSATVHPNGSLIYRPNDDFFGTDVFTVIAHDGRDHSGTVSIQVDVLPVPDGPTGITVTLTPIPEHAKPGFVLGPLNVNDVDLNDNHQIDLDDPRFVVHNGQLIFIGGDLDFETEQLIPVTIDVFDPDTSSGITEVIYIAVLDENDPITDLSPNEATVPENEAGVFLAALSVTDEDADDPVTFSVDDSRFKIVGDELHLADGVSLDYEATPQVSVEITATTENDTFKKVVTIIVTDKPEPANSIELSNQTVMELSPGHEVGDVVINGESPQDSYSIFVNDPRFEIDGVTLKLVDDQWVELASQEEIQLTISAQDKEGVFSTVSQTFVITVTENETPFHNEDSPFDVDGNGSVTAADALAIINYLNIYGPGPVGFGDPGFGYDVNGDGFVTALDALLILNELNIQSINGGNGTVGGEPEDEDGNGNGSGPEGEQVQQPESIPVQQTQDLILPQQIATGAQEDHYYEGYPDYEYDYAYESDSESYASNASIFASDYASDYEDVMESLASEQASDDFTRSLDDALQSVIRNSMG